MPCDNLGIIVILPDHCLLKFLAYFITNVNILSVCISSKTHILRYSTLINSGRKMFMILALLMVFISIFQVNFFAQKDDKKPSVDNLKPN